MKKPLNLVCLYSCLGLIMFVMLGAECTRDDPEPEEQPSWIVVDLRSDEFQGEDPYFDYFVAEENSSDFFMVKHQSGIPTEVHYKSLKVGDGNEPGISVFFDHTGFPYISVIDGHVIVLNKLDDNKHADMAIVYPDSSIKVFENLEMPLVWDFGPDKAEYYWETTVRWAGRGLSVASCIASLKATYLTVGAAYPMAKALCVSAVAGFIIGSTDYQTLGATAVIVGLVLETINTFVGGGVSNPGQAIPAIMSLGAVVADWVADQIKEVENKPTGTAQNRIGVGVSLNGRWRRSDGLIIRISGSNGYFDAFGSTWQHVANKGFVKIGDNKFFSIVWRWSAQRGEDVIQHFTYYDLWYHWVGSIENIVYTFTSDKATMELTNNNNTLITKDKGRGVTYVTHTYTRVP